MKPTVLNVSKTVHACSQIKIFCSGGVCARILVLLMLPIVTFLAGCVDKEISVPDGKPDAPIEVELTVNGVPTLNNIVYLQLTAKPLVDAPNTSAEISLPDGIQLVEGKLAWKGDAAKGDIIKLNASVKAVKVGTFSIVGSATSSQTGYVFGKKDTVWLTVSETTGTVSDVPPKVTTDNRQTEEIPK